MSKVIVDEIQTDTTNGNVRVIPNGTGALEVKGAGGDDAILQLNCSAQSHGVKLKSPAHSASQSYTMILPDNNIAADKYLKVKSIASGSGTTAVGQLEFGDVAAGVTSDDTLFNTFAGTDAGSSIDTNPGNSYSSRRNTFFGYKAGAAITTGQGNTFFGDDVGLIATTASANIGIGREVFKGITAAINNSCIGNQSCTGSLTGADNVVYGNYVMASATSANKNISIGNSSFALLTTGYENIAIGYQAGYTSTDSYSDTFVGTKAGYSRSGGNSAVGIGHQALYSLTTANWNVAIGASAGYNVTSGHYNTILGHTAGYNVTTGYGNVLLGYGAGGSASPSGSITTGHSTICLGDNSISNLYCADTSISSSDSRDKTDVTSFNIGLAWIEALRPVTYRWDRRTWYGTDEEPYGTPDGSKKRQRLHIGFLAQEALEVEKANGYGNSNDDSLILNLTDDGMSYGMKYERLVPILVNAIKELSTRVKTLEGG